MLDENHPHPFGETPSHLNGAEAMAVVVMYCRYMLSINYELWAREQFLLNSESVQETWKKRSNV